MSDAIVITAGLIFVFLGLFLLPQFLTRRAVPGVVRAFRAHKATSPESARTAEELGLTLRPFVQRIFRPRDYKPIALNALMAASVVRATADEKLYLDEARLASTPLARR